MTIATEMRKLTEDIASSRQNRAQRLTEIKEEANQVRREAKELALSFQANRADTVAVLKKGLARDKAKRKSEATQILKEAQHILSINQTSRKEATAQLRKSLTSGAADRRTEVKKTLQGAQQLIRGFCVSRKETGSELRRNLVGSRSSVKYKVAGLLGNAEGLMKDFQQSRQEGGARLRKNLAKDRFDRESVVRQMRNDIRMTRANTQAELKAAAAAWRGLTRVAPSPKVKLPEVEEAGSFLAKEQARDIETKLLAAVNEHPEGITLAEVADGLGVATIVLGRASKSLQDKGKIRREERLYFPLAE